MNRAAVIYRLLLAALLWFASGVLLWTPIPSALDALTVIGCYALSAALLDLASRFRARDLYALLTLAGIYGLLAALLIHPATALIDMPRTLFTRALGGHTLMGMIALAIFLTPCKPWRSSIGALILGGAWGIWAKWTPVELWGAAAPTDLLTLTLSGSTGAAVIAAVALIAARYERPRTFRLSPLGWLIVGMTGTGLLLFHAAQGRIDGVTAVIVLTLAGFGAAILWFQKRVKGTTLLDAAPAIALRCWFPPVIAFAVGAVIGWLLPRTDPGGVEVLVGVFAAYGVIWLPAVSLVLGARAFSRQARAFKL
jgi:hypothetical protein